MNKLFLFLCTMISLFITSSGFASTRNTSELLFHVLFLPVTFYFLITTVIQIMNPRKTIAVSLTSHTTVVICIFFLLLAIIAAKMILIFITSV